MRSSKGPQSVFRIARSVYTVFTRIHVSEQPASGLCARWQFLPDNNSPHESELPPFAATWLAVRYGWLRPRPDLETTSPPKRGVADPQKGNRQILLGMQKTDPLPVPMAEA